MKKLVFVMVLLLSFTVGCNGSKVSDGNEPGRSEQKVAVDDKQEPSNHVGEFIDKGEDKGDYFAFFKDNRAVYLIKLPRGRQSFGITETKSEPDKIILLLENTPEIKQNVTLVKDGENYKTTDYEREIVATPIVNPVFKDYNQAPSNISDEENTAIHIANTDIGGKADASGLKAYDFPFLTLKAPLPVQGYFFDGLQEVSLTRYGVDGRRLGDYYALNISESCWFTSMEEAKSQVEEKISKNYEGSEIKIIDTKFRDVDAIEATFISEKTEDYSTKNRWIIFPQNDKIALIKISSIGADGYNIIRGEEVQAILDSIEFK